MGVGYNPKIITSGIEFCFDPINPKSYNGGSTIRDISGNNKNGTLNGTYTLTNIENVRCLSFTSNSSPVSNLVQSNTINLRTISIWYNRRSGGFSCPYIIDTRNNMAAGYITSCGGFGPGIGGWADCRVYQNGIDITNSVGNGNINNLVSSDTTGLFSIGGWRNLVLVNNANYNCNIRFFSRHTDNEAANVALSHIVAYNRALTPQEVLGNYNALKGRFNL